MPESAGELSESDLAMIDALQLLLGLIVAGSPETAGHVAQLLDGRIQHWVRTNKSHAATILGVLKDRATSPEALRRQIELIAQARDPGKRGH